METDSQNTRSLEEEKMEHLGAVGIMGETAVQREELLADAFIGGK